ASIPVKGHVWGEWTVTREPSATAAGEKQRTCTACGEKETRPVAALGEDKEAEAFRTAVAALDDANGAKELLAAIKTALTAYGKISQEGKASVAEEYAKVESAIESYNALASKANAELKSATDAAISAFASGLSAINALAVAWAVLKSTHFV
ncbi:MAG: hypothetical protein K2J30_03350, partial [Clostridia bacterium]|nr:hypothetical protein [Clostridia bacterium]